MKTIKKLRKIYIFYFIAMTLVLLSQSCNDVKKNNPKENSQTNPDSSLKESEIYVDLKKLLEKKNDADASTVEVKYDHYFNSAKKYKGYSISTMIDSILKSKNFDTSNADVVFECTDGYKPVMDISKIFGKSKGYVVFKDLDQTSGKNWPDSVSEKFEPFYLVWDDIEKEDNSFAWPYGLIGFRIRSMEEGYKDIYPENLSLRKGFNLFRDNCIKCHSVNKIGGAVGPEFNIPKNITEYWKEENIISFAKNPASYRYNSRMPAITGVQDSDFKEIVSYLKYMKNNKKN